MNLGHPYVIVLDHVHASAADAVVELGVLLPSASVGSLPTASVTCMLLSALVVYLVRCTAHAGHL